MLINESKLADIVIIIFNHFVLIHLAQFILIAYMMALSDS